MSELFCRQVLRVVVAELCQAVGFDSAHESSLDVLVDILQRFLVSTGKISQSYAENCQNTNVHLNDVMQCFSQIRFPVNSLSEYMQQMEVVKLKQTVSKFPIPKKSNLQFPGISNKHEQFYINDYFPPTKIPKIKAQDENKESASEPKPNAPSSNIVNTKKQDLSDDDSTYYNDDRHLTKPEDIPTVHGTAASSFTIEAPSSSNTTDVRRPNRDMPEGVKSEKGDGKSDDPLWVKQYVAKLESSSSKKPRESDKKRSDAEGAQSGQWDSSSFSRGRLHSQERSEYGFNNPHTSKAKPKSITSRIEEVDRLLHDPIIENLPDIPKPTLKSVEVPASSPRSSTLQVPSSSSRRKTNSARNKSRPPQSVDDTIDAVINRATREAEEAELMKFSHLIDESSSSDDEIVKQDDRTLGKFSPSYDNFSPARPPLTPSPALSTNSMMLDESDFVPEEKVTPVHNIFDDDNDDFVMSDDVDDYTGPDFDELEPVSLKRILPPPEEELEPEDLTFESPAPEKKKKKSKHKDKSSKSKKKSSSYDNVDYSPERVESTKAVEKLVLKKSRVGEIKIHKESSPPLQNEQRERLPLPKLSAALIAPTPSSSKKKEKKEKKKKNKDKDRDRDRDSKKRSKNEQILPIPKITFKMPVPDKIETPEIKTKSITEKLMSQKDPKKLSVVEPKSLKKVKSDQKVSKKTTPLKISKTLDVGQKTKKGDTDSPKEVKSSKKSNKSGKTSDSKTPSKPSTTKSLQAKSSKSSSQAKVTTQTIHIAPTAGIVYDEMGNKIWICPGCGKPDDGSPMIGCDGTCEAWYHWPCVGITKEPPDDEEWFCPNCAKKNKKKSTKRKK